MSNEDFVSVPIADVDPSWLEDSFLPAVDMALAGSNGCVYMLTADSSEEVDYLMARIRERARKCGRKVHHHLLSEEDPILDWGRLFGSLEEPVVAADVQPRDVVLLSGTCRLPLWFVKVRLHLLRFFAIGAGVIVVLPLSRSVVAKLPDGSECHELVRVPAIADAHRIRLRSLVDWMLCAESPTLRNDPENDRSLLRSELADHFSNAMPKSRLQLREWIHHYEVGVVSGQYADFPNAVRQSPPPVPGIGGQKSHLLSRDSLHERFKATEHRLSAINDQFMEIMHRPLYREWGLLRDPFLTEEPHHWFESLVSYLSCLLFDAGKNGLLITTNYQLKKDPFDIIGEMNSDLPNLLRTLRTLFQHGLNPNDSHDQNTIRLAEMWFHKVVGTHMPIRHHFRRLTHALLTDWELLLADLTQLAEHIGSCPSVGVLINELDRAERIPPRIDLFRITNNVIRMLKAETHVDCEIFIRKHEKELRLEFTNSCVPLSNLQSFIEECVERKVAKEMAKSPIQSKWLIERGIEGPNIGKLLKEFEEEWLKCYDKSPEEFMTYAESRIATIQVVKS